tara:strand:+ start:10459 stop:11544 length:1086 start_codon:yes stop_codon:yes gene_type:complete
MSRDLYQILEVNSRASAGEIKSAYRTLARKYHPDANPDNPEAGERFKEIASAYEILSDPNRRARYDQFGETGTSSSHSNPFGDFSDIFSSFFGGQSSGPSGPRVEYGEDLEIDLEIGFEEAVFGTQKEIRVRTAVPCEPCGSTGATAGTEPIECTRCSGIGQIQEMRRSILGQMLTQTICPDCKGSGSRISNPCKDCNGEGRKVTEIEFTIDVQQGVDHGNTLRLSGRGATGRRGGPPGDLYVHLRVAVHPELERQGHDLRHRLHIPMTQAIFGVDLDYATLDGEEVLSIAPGTQSGHILKLKGKGVPHLNSKNRGDFFIEVIVDTPTDLTREEEETLREYASQRKEEISPNKKKVRSRRR